MSVTIYGIKNCDTMKKARAWLDKHSVDYAFHDYKTAGIERAQLEQWSKKVGWETLLNRAGTTFKKLHDKEKDGITPAKAIALMLKQPSLDVALIKSRGKRTSIGRSVLLAILMTQNC